MVILVVLYAILVWLVFFRLQIIRWGWLSGTVAVLIGAAILATFLALLNHYTPSGPIVVSGRVAGITPNVSGQVVAIPVKPNEPVKAGDILFDLDKTPFQYKVDQLKAALVGAEQNAKVLTANYASATANVDSVTSQLQFQTQRLNDLQKLTRVGATTEFREQDQQSQVQTPTYQLNAAKAAQLAAKIAMESEIGGENTAVAQTQAQVDDAQWQLEQTTVRAPADGYATVIALAVGDRALQARSAMAFIPSNQTVIIGFFSPNGFQTIKPGARVILVFDTNPGRLYEARITEIPRGVGQGQIATSGMLARVGAIGGANAYPAAMSLPPDLDPELLRLGVPGKATVVAADAGVIGTIAWALLWVGAYLAYL
jgi:multidrug resistance efflux pump